MSDIYSGMSDDGLLPSGATEFEWDDGNATKSWTKHQVTRAECEQVFFRNPLVAVDVVHSLAERRWFALGTTQRGRPLTVVFTMRGTKIRVISARPMSRREREVFDNG